MSLNHPAAKLASQGHAHVSTDAQIKFLYYPLNGGMGGKEIIIYSGVYFSE